MRLVEQHIIKQGDPRFARLDAAAFASKNLRKHQSVSPDQVP